MGVNLMDWFARDHTGRSLTERERTFLTALVTLLSEIQPAQIDPAETALTAEGNHVLIVLIPHRALNGISIVVWLTKYEGEVSLAQIGGLETHDDLDLGVGISRTKIGWRTPDFAPLVDRVREQLLAPLRVRIYGPNQATVWVRDDGSILREVGFLGKPLARRRWLSLRPEPEPILETEIRFVDLTPPPIVGPSGVDEWFAYRRNR